MFGFLKNIDPEYRRTLVCLTKIDIMDRGESVKKTLLNEDLPMKMGFIGVVNLQTASYP